MLHCHTILMNKQQKTNDVATAVTIIKKMRAYSNKPCFVKKKEQAVAFIKKNGLPKSFSEKNK